jgi:hypothetical protein
MRIKPMVVLACLGAPLPACECGAALQLWASYTSWLANVPGPVVDPGISSAFNPANGSEQPVAPDMFASQGLVLHAWQDLVARQYPWAPNAYYITMDAPGASLELRFTASVSAAWIGSGLNFGVGSAHGFLIQFYNGDALLGQSTVYNAIGAISSTPFDRVVIAAPWSTDVVWLSNVYFVPIPGPGAGVLLLGALAARGGRRRRR